MTRIEELKKNIMAQVREFYELTRHKENGEAFVPGMSRIPFGGRVYDAAELINLVDSSLDFWLTAGNYAAQFEESFASYLGIEYCSLVNSGSSANLLAFMALTSSKLGNRRIRRGDEVITVAAGFPTTVSPIVQYGAVPVFIDVTLPEYNPDCSWLEKALSDKTKAVMFAHTLGNPFDVKAVTEFCRKHNLWLIEDSCDALGSVYRLNDEDRFTGTFGDISTFSFYPAHHITTGEGGAVCTANTDLHKIIESLRDWGRHCSCKPGEDNKCGRRFTGQHGELPYGYDHKYVYSHFGYNLKVTDMQAAIGCAQIDKLDDFISARKNNFRRLSSLINELHPIFELPQAGQNSDPSWFGFPLTLKETAPYSREDITSYLETKNIQTRLLFAGNILKQPCFDILREGGDGYRIVSDDKKTLPVTDRIVKDTFWVGVYPGLSTDQIDYIAESLRTFL